SGGPLKHPMFIAAESDDMVEGNLLHELTHQFESEFVRVTFELPLLWVLERLAEFERGRWMPSQPARASVIVPISQLTGNDRDSARAVFSFIADEYGTDGIRKLLFALRDNAADAGLEKAFGLSVDEFERRFEGYMRAY